MGNTATTVRTVRKRLDALWSKVRRMEQTDPQHEERSAPAPVRRCSYCRQPGHYRPTCQEFAADLAELHAAYEDNLRDLAEAEEDKRRLHEEKAWWVDEAFRLREENEELRRALNSMGVSAGPTRGR
jgi:hypothetical protein